MKVDHLTQGFSIKCGEFPAMLLRTASVQVNGVGSGYQHYPVRETAGGRESEALGCANSPC